ncbi:hypothetical protein BSL78_21142 [Apostichopus japonicus]|uniref:Uncharacterized protein n=1 Tax=Stichopus japonicus TaxID=307972 RepID=A0A2G8K214_STIJA|nr:hypothetical protein BSL78_21142 [Apostichopus japonicus]
MSGVVGCMLRLHPVALSSFCHLVRRVVPLGWRRIVQYGERMFAKLGHERHQVGYISQKMRELARLLLKIKETKPDVKSLYDCISPKQFDTVLEAVRNLAGLHPQTGKYKTPSLALKLGHSLQTCALIVKAECIKSEDTVKEDQADKFSKLPVIEWAHKVGTGARTTLEERKWNKPTCYHYQRTSQLHAKLSEVIEEKQKLLALSDDVTAWVLWEFKDKKLDEIEVPLDDPSYTDESEGESEVPYDEEDFETEDKDKMKFTKVKKRVTALHQLKREAVLKKESDGEETKQQQLKKHFEKHIRVQRVPRKSQCEALTRNIQLLQP